MTILEHPYNRNGTDLRLCIFSRVMKEKGIAIGRTEGKREKQIEIVKKLLEKGMKTEEIEEITGLSKEEII